MATAAEEQREQEARRAALAAGGALAVGAAAAGDATQGAVAAPVKVGATATAATIIASLIAFLADRRRRMREWLREQLARRLATSITATGDGTPSAAAIVERVIANEEEREVEFTRKQSARMLRDTAVALALPTRAGREEAVQKLLAREERYTRQRSEAMAARAFAAVDRIVVREQSPQGGFWQLSETVREHTLGCLFMGGKFWPWAVLDRVHPPRHGGCPCRIRSYGDAIAEGLMRPGDVLDVRRAIAAAAHVVMEGAIEVGDDPALLRDLLFEAHTVRLGDEMVEAGLARPGAVEAARTGLQLGVPVPESLREQLGPLGIGRDAQGFFAYGVERRTPSYAAPALIPGEAIERLTAGA